MYPTGWSGLFEAGAGERHLHRSGLCLSRVLLRELLRAEHHGRAPPRAFHKPPEVLDCLRGCGRLSGECSVTHHSRFLILSCDQPAILRSRPEQDKLLRYRRGPASHDPLRLHARRARSKGQWGPSTCRRRSRVCWMPCAPTTALSRHRHPGSWQPFQCKSPSWSGRCGPPKMLGFSVRNPKPNWILT